MESHHRTDVGSSMMDPDLVNISTSPYPEVIPAPPPEDVNEVLRKKRKAREHKACYPCRQRCDLSRPCQTCRDRDHPELCSYHPPNKRQQGEPGSIIKQEDGPNGGLVTLGRGDFDFLCRKLTALENSIADLRHELGLRSQHHELASNRDADVSLGRGNIDPAVDGGPRRPTHTDIHGVHVKNDTGEIVHLGAGSIPAMFYALQVNQGHADQSKIQAMLGKTVLPLFGLDNESATYPFVDLWGLPHASLDRAQQLAKALPSDAQMWNFFNCYMSMGYVIYAGLALPDQFQAGLTEFLINRDQLLGTSDGVSEQTIYGKTFNWLSLLFAVLASGVQCSGMPRKERELTSQVYICCSFECLRFSNFLSQSTLESLQSLIMIGNVMTNNLNAGTSWALLGLTIRLAQGLGVHRECPPNIPKSVVFPRSKIWWAILWQDSLLSVGYDRASATGLTDVCTMPPPQELGPTGAYHAVMYNMSKIGLDIVQDRAQVHLLSTSDQASRIHKHKEAVSNVLASAEHYLRDSRQCVTHRETLEHWGLYLHSSYILSELFRPAISPSAGPELAKAFRQDCVDNLVNTVEAFLGLNNITSFARTSWAAIHRALSSALLLGILGEHIHNTRARTFLAGFINIMVDLTNNVDPQEISTPIQRGLAALSKLGLQEARTPQNAMLFSGTYDRFSLGEDGSLKMENSMVTPTSNPTEETPEASPLTMLNSILWGMDQNNDLISLDPNTQGAGNDMGLPT